jgi:hypothetical protein
MRDSKREKVVNDFDLTIWLGIEIDKVNKKIEKLSNDKDMLEELRQSMWDKK